MVKKEAFARNDIDTLDLTAEKRTVAAVLVKAYKDFEEATEKISKHQAELEDKDITKRHRKSAQTNLAIWVRIMRDTDHWFRSSRQNPMSFLWCCEILDISAWAVLDKLYGDAIEKLNQGL
jgi:hypothetical protein